MHIHESPAVGLEIRSRNTIECYIKRDILHTSIMIQGPIKWYTILWDTVNRGPHFQFALPCPVSQKLPYSSPSLVKRLIPQPSWGCIHLIKIDIGWRRSSFQIV